MVGSLESALDLHDDGHLVATFASLAVRRIQVEFSVHSLNLRMTVFRVALLWSSSLFAVVLGFDRRYSRTFSANSTTSSEAEGSRTVLHFVTLISGAASSNLISRYLNIA